MRYIYMLIVSFFLLGCSGEQMANAITKTQIAMAGNKPPTSFKVANLQTMKDYVFNMNDYTIAMPSAKASDFRGKSQYGGKKAWKGLTHYNKDITLYLEGYYHITVGTSGNTLKYGERARAIEYKDAQYMKNRMRLDKGDSLSISNYGKESYPCIVIDTYNKKYKKSEKIFGCYKFNSTRTKAKSVTISLTYNKPTNPTLAKQYTFKDLKQRAKRMLDSLYIKDGW